MVESRVINKFPGQEITRPGRSKRGATREHSRLGHYVSIGARYRDPASLLKSAQKSHFLRPPRKESLVSSEHVARAGSALFSYKYEGSRRLRFPPFPPSLPRSLASRPEEARRTRQACQVARALYISPTLRSLFFSLPLRSLCPPPRRFGKRGCPRAYSSRASPKTPWS